MLVAEQLVVLSDHGCQSICVTLLMYKNTRLCRLFFVTCLWGAFSSARSFIFCFDWVFELNDVFAEVTV